jgi:hypothetical protein
MIRRLLVISLLIGAADSFAEVPEITDQEVKELVGTKVRMVQALARHPALVEAVKGQNGERLSAEEVLRRDDEWKSGNERYTLKMRLQRTEAGDLLRKFVARNDSFNEAFLTDNQGANVAAFPPTSDYWQGDEEKWTASYNDGQGKIFIGPPEFDDSTKSYAVQVSAPVSVDEQTVGVLVVGVTVDYFETKRGKQ